MGLLLLQSNLWPGGSQPQEEEASSTCGFMWPIDSSLLTPGRQELSHLTLSYPCSHWLVGLNINSMLSVWSLLCILTQLFLLSLSQYRILHESVPGPLNFSLLKFIYTVISHQNWSTTQHTSHLKPWTSLSNKRPESFPWSHQPLPWCYHPPDNTSVEDPWNRGAACLEIVSPPTEKFHLP